VYYPSPQNKICKGAGSIRNLKKNKDNFLIAVIYPWFVLCTCANAKDFASVYPPFSNGKRRMIAGGYCEELVNLPDVMRIFLQKATTARKHKSTSTIRWKEINTCP